MSPATEPPDFYGILGVLRTATPEEIEAAFRAAARKCHPDVCPDDADAGTRFKRLNEAHEVLADPEKRRCYDQRRAGVLRARQERPTWAHAWTDAKAPAFAPEGGMAPGHGAFGPPWLSSPLREWLESWLGQPPFGPSPDGPSAKHEADVDAELPLSPEEAIFGGALECSLALPGPCPECGGRGRLAGLSCACCRGEGHVPGPAERLRIEVPPGVSHGSVLRVRGAGRWRHPTGRRGDLYLHVRIRAC